MLVILALVGIILIFVSMTLPHAWPLAVDFSRELGVVLLSACSVSRVYEFFVAEKHFAKFAESLKSQIERGETNAAVCERLGILRIFGSRAQLEEVVPLRAYPKR